MVLRISAFSHPSFIGLQRRFLASLEMTIKESHQSLILSHQSVVPRYSPLLSNFWRYPFPVSSSRAQPRDLSCTAVTVTLALPGKRRLGASYSAFSHPSFIALQRRFLASLEMTIRESDVSQSPSHQSLEVSHPRFQTWIPHFPYRHPERSRGIFLALRSLSHWHWPRNDALVLRILLSHTHHLSVCKEDFSLCSK